jgi:NAD(P)-dependent dehydrogenase (short-subunit alcohol dehydrogenase family)
LDTAEHPNWAPSLRAPRCLHRRVVWIRTENPSNEVKHMLLQDKVAVIYGAGGAIGGAVAEAYAREGARVFLTGRRRASVDAVAKRIGVKAKIDLAEVDALDERAIDAHLDAVVTKAGRVDIAFDATAAPTSEVIGAPLAEMDADQFARPIAHYTRAYFLTARLAARRMLPHKRGVILTVTALPARTGTPMHGGFGPAQAAKEQLTRDLSLEFAPQGIRVLGLRPHGLLETQTMRDVFAVKARGGGVSWEQFQGFIAGMTHRRRAMVLEEVANMAVFVASDRASGLTGTTLNMTLGGVAD